MNLSGMRSSFYNYVLEEVATYQDDYQVVKAGFLERLVVKSLSPEDMHPNPKDEFVSETVGPNDEIINSYVRQIPMLQRCEKPIFTEPIMVEKMLPKGYLILNGHHRWAAALMTGLSKVSAKIVNPS